MTAPSPAADPAPHHTPTRPPRAPKRADRQPPRVHHGDSFADPWEWLRDKEDPEVLDHLRAENAWADHVLAPSRPLQAQLVEEYRSHTLLTDATVPVRDGDFWYFRRTTEGHSYPSHHRVPVADPGDAGALPPVPEPGIPLPGETLLVDEEAEAAGQAFFTLTGLTPSPDGCLIAWQRDVAGDERFAVVVQDATTGQVLETSLVDTGYCLAWSEDSTTLLYTRVDDAWRHHQVWAHRLGSDPAEDLLLLQEDDERFELWFEAARDPHWVTIHSSSTTTSEAWLWPTAHPTAQPLPVTGRTPDVLVSVEPAGDHLLLVHTATSREGTLAAAALPSDLSPWIHPVDEGGTASVDGASRRADAPLAPPATWEPLREAGPGERLLDVEAHATFCVLSMRAGGSTRLEYRMRTPALVDAAHPAQAWGEGHVVGADSPVGTISSAGGARFEDTVLYAQIQSMVTPPTVVALDPATGSRTDLKMQTVPGWNPADYTEERLWVPARDGHTRIPVSLVRRSDTPIDGSAPGWLYGYGSYEVSIDPEFSVLRLPMLERGVVYAIAHVRGGGEMGRAWYEDGKLDVKEHTFTDFVDVGHFLVASGRVAPGRLVAEGGSAGGLLMGAAMNLAPDLFRVVLAAVPFVDALTTILDPTLPLTAGEWEEWGNPIEDPHIYAAMRAYTPYENVRDGVTYPAVFASTSLNDTRVFFVEPAKWVQRLREATASGQEERPVVLRTEMVAGHGGRSGREGRWESRAEEYAFGLSQVGVRA